MSLGPDEVAPLERDGAEVRARLRKPRVVLEREVEARLGVVEPALGEKLGALRIVGDRFGREPRGGAGRGDRQKAGEREAVGRHGGLSPDPRGSCRAEAGT